MFSCGSALLNNSKVEQPNSADTRQDHVKQLNDAYAMFFKQPKMTGFNEVFSPLGKDLKQMTLDTSNVLK